MTTLNGQLEGSSGGYDQHSIELSFDNRLKTDPDVTTIVPFSRRSTSNDAGSFTLEIPDNVDPIGAIQIAVFDPTGARLLRQTRNAIPPANQVLQLNVQPSTPFTLDEHPDPFLNAPEKFFGHLIPKSGSATVVGRQVVLFGKRKLESGATDPIETVLGLTQSATNGYFSMPYPRVFWHRLELKCRAILTLLPELSL